MSEPESREELARQIADLSAEGMTAEEVATRLAISVQKLRRIAAAYGVRMQPPGARDKRRFARHDPHPEANQERESQPASVGHPAEICLVIWEDR